MKTYLKMLMRSMWQTRARFLSILAIVAIGVGFLGGLLSTTPDMEITLDGYYDRLSYYDIDLKNPLGMSGDDLEAVLAMPVVASAQRGMSVDLNMEKGGETVVVRVYSADMTDPERINAFELLEGRLPEGPGECAVSVLNQFYNTGGLGDVYTLSEENDNAAGFDDAGGMTVTGIIRAPGYISLENEPTNVGSGRVGVVMYASPECFDSEVYSDIFVRLKGAEELSTFGEDYYALVSAAMDELSALGEVRSDIRHDEVYEEYSATLEDARAEYAKASKEAHEEFAEAEKELADALAKLEEGRAELEQGRLDYENGLQELEDARKELEEGRAEIEKAEKELPEKKAELEKAKQDIKSAEDELRREKARLEESKKELEDAKVLFAEKKAEYDAAVAEISDAESKIAEARALIEEKTEELNAGKAELRQNEIDLAVAQREFSEQNAKYYEGREMLRKYYRVLRTRAQENLAESPEELAAELERLDQEEAKALEDLESNAPALYEAKAQLKEAENKLNEAKKTIADAEAELEAGRKEVEEGEKELAEGKAQLESASEEIAKAEAEFEDYDRQVESGERQIRNAEKQLADARKEIADGEIQLVQGERDLAAYRAQLADGEKALADGEMELADALTAIEDGEKELADGEKQYAEGLEEYRRARADAEEQLLDAADQIAEGERQLSELDEIDWMILERKDAVSYACVDDNIGKVGAIAEVFPIFFFFVAALVALTTMTRMVEEERPRIGTLKCLGYSNGKILAYYLGYAAAAGILGSIVGAAACFTTLPRIIAAAYSMVFHMPTLVTPFRWDYLLIIAPAAILCTCAATLWSCMGQLREEPASILRPKAPKVGKRVLLEYVPFLWKRMSFTAKVTVRNIFRYKKRFFMTVTGIAGCCALLLAGFGIRDSIGDIASMQFEGVYDFDVSVYLRENADIEGDRRLKAFLESERVTGWTALRSDSATAEGIAINVQLPGDVAAFGDFVNLRERVGGRAIPYGPNSAVFTEKICEMLDLSVGDRVSIVLSDGRTGEVTVTGICENYIQNFLYIGEEAFVSAFGALPEGGTLLVKLAPGFAELHEELSTELLRSPNVTYAQFSSVLIESFESSTSGIDYIVVMLIIASGLLAVVVLYNLTNINICERRKELATLRVLGFHDGESAAYIYRETAILSLMGVLCGFGLGIWLHRFIVKTVEVDISMFGRSIYPRSFLWSALITLGFAVLVGFLLYPAIKKTDMVEAMKSGE